MKFLQRIDKWLSKYKLFLFKYKGGFFEVPYLGHSPHVMLESFKKMPFVKHDEKEQTIITNNPFIKFILHYQEIEEGLWIMHSDIEYKANVSFNRINDKHFPSDYYFLSLEINGKVHKKKPLLINGFSYPYRSWLLFKPKASAFNSHFKGSNGLAFNVYFSETWLKNVLYKQPNFINSNIKHFFESPTQYIIWPDSVDSTDLICKPLQYTFNKKGEKGVANTLELKEQVYDFIQRFIDKCAEDDIKKNYFEISDNDRKKIVIAEKILIKNLHGAFPGIEPLALKVGLAATTLKKNFKLIFGQTLFQYYQAKQMDCAKEILQGKEAKIKEVAKSFGYENASKFTAAFKKHFGVLPSEI